MLTELFNTTCTISSPGWTKGSDGSAYVSVSSVGSPIPCALQGVSAAEALQYQREYGSEGLNLYLPYTYGGSAVSIGHDSLVTVGGVNYKVRGPAMDMGGRGEFYKVNVELLK